MWWSAHPGTIGSSTLGKDEVPGSNPGISSTRLAEMQVFFVVSGWFLQEFARSPSFSETSLLFCHFVSYLYQFFAYLSAHKPCDYKGLRTFFKSVFASGFKAISTGDRRGGVAMLTAAFHIMLQGHSCRGVSCCRLGLFDVLCHVVEVS